MVTPMRDNALLTLTQMLSPSFPTGGFAYSQGLEWAVRDGQVGPASLQDWLTVLLDLGTGRNDAILLHLAAGADDPGDLADLALALCPAAERRAETLAQGTAFAATVRAVWGVNVSAMALPVAVGRAARLLALDPGVVAQVYLHGMVTTLVLAAQRLMPLGQTAAHGIIAALAPVCVRVARDTADLTADDLGGFALLQDIGAMRHEVQEPRIFRS
jgi:urease accessory protein